MLTKEIYDNMPDGIFAKGVIQNNNENGIFLTGSMGDKNYGRLLKRVATKNQYDWRMYFGRADEMDFETVASNGDSSGQIDQIQRILNCDDEVMKLRSS